MTKARYNKYVKHGLSIEAVARLELSDLIETLVNATPSLIWLLFYIYSTREIQDNLKSKISSVVSTKDSRGSKKAHAWYHYITRALPLLLSTCRANLCIKTNSVSSLWVWQDTVINDQYLPKIDSIVPILGAPMHTDATLWGSDVEDFNPRRFLKGTTKHRPGVFRTFGGGTRLHPGDTLQ